MDLLTDFVGELRSAGIPVSLTESLDAHASLSAIGVENRSLMREALAAALVKNASHRVVFDTAFEVFFGLTSPDGETSNQIESDAVSDESPNLMGQKGQGKSKGTGAGSGYSPEELAEMLYNALLNGDQDRLRQAAQNAVSAYAGMEPGRPVGGTYYLYRTLRNLDLDSLLKRLINGIRSKDSKSPEADAIEERLNREEAQARIEKFKKEIEEEIRRRLVADRGRKAMAKTLRKPLPEDIDVMHASREEMVQLKHAIAPLARKLASRLAMRRRHKRKGPLDWRATMRASLAMGGVPAEPKFKHPRQAKPDIVILSDISGSVASFARFTLQLVYALSGQFSRVRSFVFIDGIDEVTSFFETSDDVMHALHRINTEADVMWLDGHSDYGHAFTEFWGRWPDAIGARTSVLVLGDARNNYHATQSWVLEEIAQKAKHLYWLNPEPKAYWGSGDSVVGEYGSFCDGVHEVRTLRQLEKFVGSLD